MIRIFETGDLHIGKAYADKNKHPKGSAIAEKRIEAVRNMVEYANDECCKIFAITGDLFDKTNGIAKKKIESVVEILSRFKGTVLVLPGNHDYYSNDASSAVWNIFIDAAKDIDNIILLNSFEPYELTIGDDEVVVYPAFCHIDTAPENNLGWIKALEIPKDNVYRIGMAHGAIKGETIDNEGVYFLMSREELDTIPMDIWLIGHTHVMFPKNLTTSYSPSCNVLNAGTHVQTDVHNNTDGNCFIIELSKTDGNQAEIRAKKYVSGNLSFRRFDIHIEPNGSGSELKDAISKAIDGVDIMTSVSLILSGSISRTEYANRENIYSECMSPFFEYPHPVDNKLTEIISEDFIKSEFSEITFPAKLLMELVNNPKQVQMAYDLLKSGECQA